MAMSKSGRMIMITCINFLRNKNYVKKIIPETVHYINFISKFIWNHLYLSFVSFILNHLQKYFLQLEHHIELLVHW